MLKKLSKEFIFSESKRMLWAIFGTALYAAGVNLFVAPSGMYTGGLMGLCQLLRTFLVDVLHMPFQNFDVSGIIYYLINVPIFVLAIKKCGKIFFAKTVVCVTAITFFMTVIPVPAVPILGDDILAASVIGGILSGVGIGMGLKMGSSGGGMDIVGLLLIKWKKDFSVGKINLFVNILLYGICLFMFNIATVIYSVINAAIYSIAMDRVHTQNINVQATIITKNVTEEMQKEVFFELGRGMTKWESEGAFTQKQSTVLFILLSKYEVDHLKMIVRKYDPNAFIVVCEGVSVDGNYVKKL